MALNIKFSERVLGIFNTHHLTPRRDIVDLYLGMMIYNLCLGVYLL